MAETRAVKRGVRTRLTLKERLFVHHLAAGETQVRAAQLAGVARNSEQGHHNWAQRALGRPLVQAALEAEIEAEVSAVEVKARLSEQARLDTSAFARCYLDDVRRIDRRTGQPADPDDPEAPVEIVVRRLVDWTRVRRLQLGHLIQKVTRNARGDESIEWYDHQAALVHMGRRHKLWVDRVDVADTTEIKQLTTEQLRAIVEGRPLGPPPAPRTLEGPPAASGPPDAP
jgi:hypothetical protein